MKRTPARILTGIILTVTIASAVLYASTRQTANISSELTDKESTPLPETTETLTRTPLQAAAHIRFEDLFGTQQTHALAPVSEFFTRIVKKPFGIFITPETSPIQGDRFTGYHTGVDVEFTDTDSDIPVHAIADGTIVVSQWMKGYGGVIVIRHIIDTVPVYALYGHLNVESFSHAINSSVLAGEQIAILGHDHSQETDGVRKHLHFSISTTDTLDVRGYVQTEDELTHWLNPLDLFAM